MDPLEKRPQRVEIASLRRFERRQRGGSTRLPAWVDMTGRESVKWARAWRLAS